MARSGQRAAALDSTWAVPSSLIPPTQPRGVTEGCHLNTHTGGAGTILVAVFSLVAGSDLGIVSSAARPAATAGKCDSRCHGQLCATVQESCSIGHF